MTVGQIDIASKKKAICHQQSDLEPFCKTHTQFWLGSHIYHTQSNSLEDKPPFHNRLLSQRRTTYLESTAQLPESLRSPEKPLTCSESEWQTAPDYRSLVDR